MPRPIEHEVPDYRNNPLRRVQSVLQGEVPLVIQAAQAKSWLRGTELGVAYLRGEDLHPDQVTLTGLQFSLAASRALVEGERFCGLWQYFVGLMFDGADGMVARDLGLASSEGAVKDVIADRIAELFMVTTISKERQKYSGYDGNRFQNLFIACQLSTLTKAASVMYGVDTDEGGMGGMLERRKSLFSTLSLIGKLNRRKARGIEKGSEAIIARIDKQIDQLIGKSYQKAEERALKIGQAQSQGFILERNQLNNPLSAAAVEARKYALLLKMNEDIFGIDIQRNLQALVDGVYFPTYQELSDKFSYIGECSEGIRPFMERAKEIAGFVD